MKKDVICGGVDKNMCATEIESKEGTKHMIFLMLWYVMA